jgi:hypothetical protein
MVPAIHSIYFGLALLLAAATSAPSWAADSLSISADAPVVTLPERAPGRRELQLPALEYQLQIHARCTLDRVPQSLLLSIADTRKSIAATGIVADGVTKTSFQVPASQIPPVAIEKFCVVAENQAVRPAGSAERLTIPAALSLSVSLLCAGTEDGVMTYASQPLDVSLECTRTATTDDAPLIDTH